MAPLFELDGRSHAYSGTMPWAKRARSAMNGFPNGYWIKEVAVVESFGGKIQLARTWA
jgi:hypothetical protein